MSVDKKIKQILEAKKSKKSKELAEAAGEAGDSAVVMQGSSEKPKTQPAGEMADTGVAASKSMKKDTSKASTVATAGDAQMPKQGSSQDASMEVASETEKNLGAKMSSSVKKDTTLPEKGKGDAKSAKVPAMEDTETQEINISEELSAIFGDDSSQEFKDKASSLFETAVIARVNHEMEAVTQQLSEDNENQLIEFKQELIEKVDNYLNYVVEQWIDENQVAVENGIRNEISEDFMTGLKQLFKENYIKVPDNKVDVVEELTNKVDSLTYELNEAIEDNITLSKDLVDNRKSILIEEATDDLAATEAEKLKKLLEGVDYDDDDLFREKVNVVKENYFPKTEKKSPEKVLSEETATDVPLEEPNDKMSKYASALSRTVKSR